jgi:hypothetical protein
MSTGELLTSRVRMQEDLSEHLLSTAARLLAEESPGAEPVADALEQLWRMQHLAALPNEQITLLTSKQPGGEADTLMTDTLKAIPGVRVASSGEVADVFTFELAGAEEDQVNSAQVSRVAGTIYTPEGAGEGVVYALELSAQKRADVLGQQFGRIVISQVDLA